MKNPIKETTNKWAKGTLGQRYTAQVTCIVMKLNSFEDTSRRNRHLKRKISHVFPRGGVKKFCN